MTGPSALAALGADVEWTDSIAAAQAREHLPAGNGRLAELAEWLAATRGSAQATRPARPRALILTSDSTTDGPARALAEVARRHEVGVRLVPAPSTPTAAFEVGTALADEEVDSGTDLVVLGGADARDTTPALVSLILGTEPIALLPRGSAAVDTYAWIKRANRLRDDRRRISALRSDPDALLESLGSPALALATALLMRVVARRTPVILDGPLAMTAALLCYDTTPRTGRWWRVADTSNDPVHQRVLAEFAQDPILCFGTDRSDGMAGVLAVAVLQAAAELADRDAPVSEFASESSGTAARMNPTKEGS